MDEMSEMIQRIMLNNIEAEHLGEPCSLTRKLYPLLQSLFEKTFTGKHKEIFDAIVDIYNKGEPRSYYTH